MKNTAPGNDASAAVPLKLRSKRVPIDSTGVGHAIISEQAATSSEDHADSVIMEVRDMIESQLRIQSNSSNQKLIVRDEKGEATEVDPYENADPHIVLCGKVTAIADNYVTVQQQSFTPPGKKEETSTSAPSKHLWSIDTINIPYTHLIYALGSHMPDPLKHESYTKKDSMHWMERNQNRIRESQDIILVGGGALGVQLAGDIASYYNKIGQKKNITLIHSRDRLLPNFDPQVHTLALEQLQKLGVQIHLGHRLAIADGCPLGSSVKQLHIDNAQPSELRQDGIASVPGSTRHRIRTTLGLEQECDLLLMCTGQQPNSELMAEFSPSSVSPQSRLIHVLPSLQVMQHEAGASQQPFDAVPPCKDCDCFLDKKSAGADMDFEEKLHVLPHHIPNVYAIGDVADAFGALNAGYQAWFMAEVAAENILRDILRVKSSDTPDRKVPDNEPIPLKHFEPGPALLKLTVGLNSNVVQKAPASDLSLPGKVSRPSVKMEDETEDMGVELVWKYMALADPSDMYL